MLARLIDGALGLLVLYLVFRLVPGSRVLGRLVLGLGALTTYEALFVLQLRATPGKLATSLRVAELDRARMDPVTGWTRAVVTSVGTLALIISPAALGVMTTSGPGLVLGAVVVGIAGGYVLSIITAPLRRGVADRIAGTIVVPFDAPEVVDRAAVDDGTDAQRPRPLTAWGRVGTNEARRRARAARLDDSPVLVVGLVAVLLAWTVDYVALAIGLACVWVALLVVDEAWRVARQGGTAGHRREGLAVVDEQTGEAPAIGPAFARALVLAVFWLFPPLLPVLWIWMQLSTTGRGPHDLVAGTVVVESTRAGSRGGA